MSGSWTPRRRLLQRVRDRRRGRRCAPPSAAPSRSPLRGWATRGAYIGLASTLSYSYTFLIQRRFWCASVRRWFLSLVSLRPWPGSSFVCSLHRFVSSYLVPCCAALLSFIYPYAGLSAPIISPRASAYIANHCELAMAGSMTRLPASWRRSATVLPNLPRGPARGEPEPGAGLAEPPGMPCRAAVRAECERSLALSRDRGAR